MVQMFLFKRQNRTDGTITDITDYVTTCNWSGDVEQAARKIDFSIAYNTKDTGFVNQEILVGGTIYMYWVKNTTSNEPIEVFRGIVFSRNRNTANFTFEFTAYDRLIYLAKSKTTRKFSNITVEDVIGQVCNDNGIEVGNICSIGVTVNFIADKQSYTEILKRAFYLAYAQTGSQYHFYLNQDKLYVVDHAETIENYIANDSVNVQSSQHGESIEDMVNTVMIVDANGAEIGRVSNDGDLSAYGRLQEVYKVEKKKDTQSAARAMLKTVAFKSSLSVVGNAQCIAGYAITVQEEQIKGIFTIKSDKHTIANGIHTMDLELGFLNVVEPVGEQETEESSDTTANIADSSDETSNQTNQTDETETSEEDEADEE